MAGVMRARWCPIPPAKERPLAARPQGPDIGRVAWNQPYLETCCRSALHRLTLCGAIGRPPGLKDGPCLERLAALGLAERRDDANYIITSAGTARHAAEIARI